MADNSIAELVQAIRQQTDAINRLINTNAALLEMLVEEMVPEGERQPTTYLSGKKI